MRTHTGKTIWEGSEKRQFINSYKRLLRIKPDLSLIDFAKSRGVNPDTFRKWLKKKVTKTQLQKPTIRRTKDDNRRIDRVGWLTNP